MLSRINLYKKSTVTLPVINDQSKKKIKKGKENSNILFEYLKLL